MMCSYQKKGLKFTCTIVHAIDALPHCHLSIGHLEERRTHQRQQQNLYNFSLKLKHLHQLHKGNYSFSFPKFKRYFYQIFWSIDFIPIQLKNKQNKIFSYFEWDVSSVTLYILVLMYTVTYIALIWTIGQKATIHRIVIFQIWFLSREYWLFFLSCINGLQENGLFIHYYFQ